MLWFARRPAHQKVLPFARAGGQIARPLCVSLETLCARLLSAPSAQRTPRISNW